MRRSQRSCRYANHVADRFNLRPDIAFDTCVDGAAFDQGSGRWAVTTSHGDTVMADYFVLATGCLSNARMPDIRASAISRARSTIPVTGRMSRWISPACGSA